MVWFYGIDPGSIPSTKTYILRSMIEMMDVITAEENLRQAQLLNLFTIKGQSKREAAEIRRKQNQYMRRQKAVRAAGLRDALVKPEIEIVNPADLDRDDQAELREWARSQGLETNQ